MNSRHYHSIEGLEPGEGIGAVVRIGEKDKQRGFPTNTDRFFICTTRELNGVRPLHEAFAGYNNAPVEKRQMLRGNIVHASRDECFYHQYKAQVLTQAHPDRRPCCTGNGHDATRWMGGDPENWKSISCPGEECEYRQKSPPVCKPWGQLLFQLRWPEGNPLPTMLVKWTTTSWNSLKSLLGMLDQVDKAAHQLGIEGYSLFGLPFTMTLSRKTMPKRQQAFPVVDFATEMSPVEFFASQQAQLAQLAQIRPLTLLEQTTPKSEFADLRDISAPAHTTGEKK
jgi:hypothetical protein